MTYTYSTSSSKWYHCLLCWCCKTRDDASQDQDPAAQSITRTNQKTSQVAYASFNNNAKDTSSNNDSGKTSPPRSPVFTKPVNLSGRKGDDVVTRLLKGDDSDDGGEPTAI